MTFAVSDALIYKLELMEPSGSYEEAAMNRMQCILTAPAALGHTATSSIRIRPNPELFGDLVAARPKGKAYGEPDVPIREKDRPRLLQQGSDLLKTGRRLARGPPRR